jgi:Domain of unknown function (DUF3943)
MSWRSVVIGVALVSAVPQMGFAQNSDEPQEQTEPPIRSNYVVPAVDIVAFDFLVNRYGYHFVDRGAYDVTSASIRHNAKTTWVVDNDPFDINQFMHPYQGAMYHGFARSAGLNYWASMGFTFAGSMLWELAGETTVPSKNDQIASGIGGSFLGEPLFRLAELILRRPDHRFWRELSALVISPSTGFNRLAYGDRFDGTEPSGNPAVFTRVQFGAMGTASIRNSLTQPLMRNEAVADFSVEYGMPGKRDYAYHHPFDYFDFQFTSSTGSRFESIFTRGLLAGKAYGERLDRSRGVWGLYGSYDYVAPQIFRVSSVALSLGNTAQWTNASTSIQSTVLAGVGYGAAGGFVSPGSTDYHYGLTPQVLGSLRFIPGDRVAVDLTFRDYYVSRYASTRGGSENIARADALLSFKITRHHAASVRYIWSRRATYGSDPLFGDVLQSRGSVGLFYTYLGGTRFGAVEF